MRNLKILSKVNLEKLIISEQLSIDRLDRMLGNCFGWYLGSTGMRKNLGSKTEEKITENFKLISSMYPVKKPSFVYRLSSISVRDLDKLEGKVSVRLGNKNILSFSKDPDFPKYFYKYFYDYSSRRKGPTSAYVNVKCKVTKDNFVLQTENVLKLCEDIINKKQSLLPITNKLIIKSAIELHKMLNQKFYKRQQEVILQHTEKANVEILEVFNYSGKKF